MGNAEKTIERSSTYLIEVTKYTDGSISMNRTNEGFNVLELLGILEFCIKDITYRFGNDFLPDIITRKVTTE